MIESLILPMLLFIGFVSGTTSVDKPSIYSLHIRSDITHRFATTKVVSKLANAATESREALFSLQLPKTAFISNFSMIIDGVEYPGVVKEKEKAKKEYEAAKKKGQSAGQVSAKPRNTNKFQVAVNVAAGKKVDFILTYQELLQRRLSAYEHVIYIDPKQLVRDFKVDIYIQESRNIKNLVLSPLKNDNEVTTCKTCPVERNKLAITDVQSKTAHISYHPSYDQQKAKNAAGLQGQLVLRYDVERDTGIGEIQVVDGYFVHFFAPKGLPKGNKNIIFVLDVSGSMFGTKIRQVKDSMQTILNDLADGDLFNVMTFESKPKVWKNTMLVANSRNKQLAVEYTQTMNANGGTNINAALFESIDFLQKEWYHLEQSNSLASIIVFLTDGDPTVGETNKDRILDNIRRKNEGRFALFSLSFGANLDYKFLQRLSAQNRGFARKIFEDSDASLQLNNFYNEISSPLLANVKFSYIGNDADSLTTVHFPALFDGGEFVVAGKVAPNNNIKAAVSAKSANGQVNFQQDIGVVNGNSAGNAQNLKKFTERLWAYLTISELLDRMLATTNKTQEAAIKAKALAMSLKYNFVTPLTSMVVIKPDDPKKDASNLDEQQGSGAPTRGSSHGPAKKHRTPVKSSAKMRPSSTQGSSFADNDPHFIINVDGSRQPICFDVNGKHDEIYQLIHDKDIGLSVNARIIDSGRKSQKGKPLTYFGKVAIVTDKLIMVATPRSFKVGTTAYNWKRDQRLKRGKITVTWPNKGRVVVKIGKDVAFTLARHGQNGENNHKAYYLGFYITNGRGLSKHVHGLMGQFQHRKVDIRKTVEKKPTGRLMFRPPNRPHSDVVVVYQGKRRNLLNKQHVNCWQVRNQGRGFLDGVTTDYLVGKLTSKKIAKKLSQYL